MPRTAVIAGVGPGLGAAIARRFAAEGLDLGLLARPEPSLEDLASALRADHGVGVATAPTDLAEVDRIDRAFDVVHEGLGPVDVLVNHATAAPGRACASSPRRSSSGPSASAPSAGCAPPSTPSRTCWPATAGRSSAPARRRRSAGTSARRPSRRRSSPFGGSPSRWPATSPHEGVHVSPVVIDGRILAADAETRHPDSHDEPFLDPDAIADTYWHLVEQDRSAWTLEVDLRPHVEGF